MSARKLLMGVHRFFVSPQSIGRSTVSLVGPQAHQIHNVLRLGLGDTVVVLDNSGWQYEVEITSADSTLVTGRVRGKSLVTTEPRTKITLYQGLLRGSRFELVLQKCTELGVVAFVPTICERSLVGNIDEASASRIQRWQRIIAEAAEQSGRGKMPTLRSAQLFQQACEESRVVSLLAWEGEEMLGMRSFLRRTSGDNGVPGKPFSINIFIGPEGGFSVAEVQRARAYGIVPVSLGARTLRAETAAIVTAAITLHEMGDMGE
ncbi:MAG: 16S rRNA (uracil(1498)-N(3))-methyltransferase [Chloroflexi bacterium]|nr:16S rRNA (uracil(1498)-N(3))-methyltransferase [Chloroflexota bacterium]